jgi:hypothetical protein
VDEDEVKPGSSTSSSSLTGTQIKGRSKEKGIVNRCAHDHDYEPGVDAVVLLLATTKGDKEGARAIAACSPCLWCLLMATVGTAVALTDLDERLENIVQQTVMKMLEAS